MIFIYAWDFILFFIFSAFAGILTLGVPSSVKLIDIMRSDPLKRFVVDGDGNALRVTLNSDQQRSSEGKEIESGMMYDPSHANAAMSNFAYFQRERRYEQHRHEPSRMLSGRSILQGLGPQYPPTPPSVLCMGPYLGPVSSENINIGHCHMRDDLLEHQHLNGRLNSNNGSYSMGMQTGRLIPEQSRVFDRSFIAHSNSPKNINNRTNNNTKLNTANNMNENVQHHYNNEQRIRADHQMRVQKSDLRNQGQLLPSHQNQNNVQNQNQVHVQNMSKNSNEMNEYHQIGHEKFGNFEDAPWLTNSECGGFVRENDEFHENRRNRRRGNSEGQIQGLFRPASFNYLLNFKGSMSEGIGHPTTSHSDSHSHHHTHFSGRDMFDRSGSIDEFTQLSSTSGSSFPGLEERYSSCDGNLSHKSITTAETTYLGILNHPNGEDYQSMEFGEFGANSTSQLSIADSMTSYFDSPTNYGSSTPITSWPDYSFGKDFSRKLSKMSNRSDNMTTNTTCSLEGNEDVLDFNYESTQVNCDNQSNIPANKWMIKAWLPLAFEGFDAELIESFISKLRDDGGFVTVQDLLDARGSFELTRESLGDIAGFKLGHYNRLERALSSF